MADKFSNKTHKREQQILRPEMDSSAHEQKQKQTQYNLYINLMILLQSSIVYVKSIPMLRLKMSHGHNTVHNRTNNLAQHGTQVDFIQNRHIVFFVLLPRRIALLFKTSFHIIHPVMNSKKYSPPPPNSAPSSLFQKIAFWRPSIVKWSP